MSDSIWKKEISLRRKKEPADDAVPEAAPEPKQSVWKKEISLGRKAKAAKPAEPAPAEPPQPTTPFWKKEISLGRKAKASEPEPVEPGEPKTPFWKKEISLSREQPQDEADRLSEEAAQIVARVFAPAPPPSPADPPPADPPPADPPPAVVEPAAAEPVGPVEPAPPAVEPATRSVLSVVPDPLPEQPGGPGPVVPEHPQPAAPQPAGEALHPVEMLDLGPQEAPAPAAAPPTAEQPAGQPAAPYAHTPLSPEIVAASAAEGDPLAPLPPAPELQLPAPGPVVPEPAAPAPAPAPAAPPPDGPLEAPAAAPLPTGQQPAPAPPEQAAAEIEAGPEPSSAATEWPPAPRPGGAVQPPIPAAELPPLPAATTPFWKKELSFSRKRKAEASQPEEPAGPKTPFWKRDLSFSRGTPEEFVAVEEALRASAPEAAEAAKPPFWKRELSLSRKPKPAADDQLPTEKAPFWKRELSFSRKPKPALDEQPTQQLPAAPAQPFWKRQLSLSAPSLSLPRLGGRSRGGGKGSHTPKKVVGLKIGASQIAAARISNNGVAELQQLARQPLSAGVVVGGELRDPDALAAALRTFFSRNRLPRKGVRLGIASNRIGVRTFDVVDVEGEKQLTNAIHFRAQEALPIPLDEAVLDYHILDESVDEEGKNVKRILLVVAHRELVDRYVAACRKAGVTLTGIDLEAFALLRSLAAPENREASALVAVAIGHDRSTFAVSDGRVCEFTRVLEWGGWSLNVAIARALDKSPSECEAIKRSLSLEGGAAPEDVPPEIVATALDAVRKQLQTFARELVSSLQFYQNQPGSLGIGEIVVTGGTAELPGLAEELERMIGVRVRVGNPLGRLKVGKKIGRPEQLGSLAVAIGLGIED